MRYVLYSEEYGVYLGSAMGLGFWSKLDAAGQDCAPTFETPEIAAMHALTWDTPVTDASPHAVATSGAYVDIQTCVAAGLPAWSL